MIVFFDNFNEPSVKVAYIYLERLNLHMTVEILYPSAIHSKNPKGFASKKNYYINRDNKKIKLNLLSALEIHDFRTFKDQSLEFGQYLTIISGQNGTMKSTLLGLAVHPFKTDKVDINQKKMSTNMRDVFNWSNNKDTDKYHYSILFNTVNNYLLKEPVEIVPEPIMAPIRHRVTVSGHAKGDGQLLLPVTYLNLKRLFPLVDMKQNISWKPSVQNLSDQEKTFISDFYFDVLQRKDFSSFESFDSRNGRLHKVSKGPDGSHSKYDTNTISSGEDNLGIIVDQLISLSRLYNEKSQNDREKELTGILAIDELEASLHPSSQRHLIDYLINFARKYKVQVIITSHSLSLITDIINDKKSMISKGLITLNFVASLSGSPKILKNPPYKVAYKELTLREDISQPLKIQVRLEDPVAENYVKNLFPDELKSFMKFSTKVNSSDTTGTTYISLKKIAVSYPLLFKETNSLIIFDADVSDELLNTVNNSFTDYIRLPSIDVLESTGQGLPIEKEIVYWAANLEPDNAVFRKIKREQQILFSQWTEKGINAGRDSFHELDIQKFKNWAKSDPVMYSQLLVEYSKFARHYFSEFFSELNLKIKNIYSKIGLPIE